MALLLGLLSGCGGDQAVQPEENHETPAEEAPAEERGVKVEPVTAPTPAVFFGVEANSVIPQWDEFVFEKDTMSAAAAYVDLLQNAFGFRVTEQSIGDQSSRWSLEYGDRENAGIDILSRFTDVEKYVVTIVYAQAIRWQDGAVYDWPEPQAEDALVPEPDELAQEPVHEPEAVRDDPSVLPDFMVYGASAGFRQGTTSSDNVVALLSEEDSVRDTTEEYVQRLLDMGYRITDTEEKANQYMDVYRWYLTHDAVGGSTVEGSAQVCVKHMLHIPYQSDDPYTEVSITFGSGVTYAGDSASGSGSSGSGSSGSGSSSSRDTFTPEFAKLDCLKCRGDGDCNTCNGYGEVRRYAGAGETVRAKCNTCHGSGKCNSCGGSGKR